MKFKRLTLLCGHYGSGKTNVAVNFAFDLKKQYNSVAIADLDIVNPYFRTKDSAKELEKAGIELICSEYAGTNIDIPAMPQLNQKQRCNEQKISLGKFAQRNHNKPQIGRASCRERV